MIASSINMGSEDGKFLCLTMTGNEVFSSGFCSYLKGGLGDMHLRFLAAYLGQEPRTCRNPYYIPGIDQTISTNLFTGKQNCVKVICKHALSKKIGE